MVNENSSLEATASQSPVDEPEPDFVSMWLDFLDRTDEQGDEDAPERD